MGVILSNSETERLKALIKSTYDYEPDPNNNTNDEIDLSIIEAVNKINTLEEQLANVYGNISSLQNDISGLNNDINNLGNPITSLDQDGKNIVINYANGTTATLNGSAYDIGIHREEFEDTYKGQKVFEFAHSNNTKIIVTYNGRILPNSDWYSSADNTQIILSIGLDEDGDVIGIYEFI
jgi:hypothetical protein